MIFTETIEPWMSMSVVCANGFPKKSIRLRSPPSADWAIAWRSLHETRPRQADRFCLVCLCADFYQQYDRDGLLPDRLSLQVGQLEPTGRVDPDYQYLAGTLTHGGLGWSTG